MTEEGRSGSATNPANTGSGNFRSGRMAPPPPKPEGTGELPAASIVSDGGPEHDGSELGHSEGSMERVITGSRGHVAGAVASSRETIGETNGYPRRSQIGEEFGAAERTSSLANGLPPQSARQARAQAASEPGFEIADVGSGCASGGDVRNGVIPGGLGSEDASAAEDEELTVSRAHALRARTKLAVALVQNRDNVSEQEGKADGVGGDVPNSSRQPNVDDFDEVQGEAVHARLVIGAEEELGEAAGEESAETRRANRLKRARLMKGHYQLAVMRSRGQEPAGGGGNQPVDEGSGMGARGSPNHVGGSPPQDSGGDSNVSDDLSDLDSESDLENVDGVDSVSEAGGENTNAANTTGGQGENSRNSSSPNSSKRRRSTKTDDASSRRSKDSNDRRNRRSRSRSHSRSPRRGRDSTAKEDARTKSRHRREPRSNSRSRGGGDRKRSNRDREAISRDRGNHGKRSSRAGDGEASGTARSGGDHERSNASDRERKAGDSGRRKRERDDNATRNGKEQGGGSSSDKSRRESERRDSRERSSRDGDSRGNRGRRDGDDGGSSRKDSRSSGARTREREEGRRRDEGREKQGSSSSSSKRSRRH